MPLLYQKRIMRTHLRANPQVLFIFGDNVQRTGLRGQAAAMRGEPNAIGIATKWAPSMHISAMFKDSELEKIEKILQADLAPVAQALADRRIVVWPMDGIGTGLSQLKDNAPAVWASLEEARKYLETL